MVLVSADGRNGLHVRPTFNYHKLFTLDDYQAITGAVSVERGNEKAGVVNGYETELYKENAKFMRELFVNGAIPDNVLDAD